MLTDILTAHPRFAAKFPGVILLFPDQMETDGTRLAVNADAVTVHRVTGLPLDSVTSSAHPTATVVTVPGPRLESILRALILAGHKVAICDATLAGARAKEEEHDGEECGCIDCQLAKGLGRCRHCGRDTDASGVCAACYSRHYRH
jgi:hypothetical protein